MFFLFLLPLFTSRLFSDPLLWSFFSPVQTHILRYFLSYLLVHLLFRPLFPLLSPPPSSSHISTLLRSSLPYSFVPYNHLSRFFISSHHSSFPSPPPLSHSQPFFDPLFFLYSPSLAYISSFIFSCYHFYAPSFPPVPSNSSPLPPPPPYPSSFIFTSFNISIVYKSVYRLFSTSFVTLTLPLSVHNCWPARCFLLFIAHCCLSASLIHFLLVFNSVL